MNRAIAWFAHNGVAANLLVLLVVAGGLLTAPRIRREVFPEIEVDRVTVSVPYPGAAPAEVEEGICVRIEEQLYGLDGIKRLSSTASEGLGVVTAELLPGAELRRVLDDVKSRVDEIDTFPEDAERPIVREILLRSQVISLAVSGAAEERALKALAQRVRDELTALPEITVAELAGARPYEISIEVSEDALRRYQLTFDDVARAVRRASLDLPGGSLKTAGGEILLRTKGQAYHGDEFSRLPLLTAADGSRVTVGDVARVVDGFEETDQSLRFDAKPAVVVQVFRVGEQSALAVADAVKRYVSREQAYLPAGVHLTVWDDDSQFLRNRLDTLLRNGRQGFILVLVLLALFLRLRLAFWVLLGVPVSFLGALWLMPVFHLSINLVSLFAFIVVLGILVDDAIVVGENVYTVQSRGMPPLEAAIVGTREVAVPVVFGVLTTVAAFVPMLAIAGTMGKVMRVIPLVVISALLFSLIESLFVLPSHLGHGVVRAPGETPRGVGRLLWWAEDAVSKGLRWFIVRIYQPSLEWALSWRYLTAAIALALLAVTVALLLGRWLTFSFFPEIEGNRVVAELTMPLGTPVEVTGRAVAQLEAAAERVRVRLEATNGGPVYQHTMAAVGEQPYRNRQRHGGGRRTGGGSHVGEVNIELVPAEGRRVRATQVARAWRGAMGEIPGAVELTFTSSIVRSGEPINVSLQGPDTGDLRRAALRLKEELATYSGVYDITDSFRGGKRELKLNIRPEAEALGLTLADLGRQVRQAFYGEEAQRVQRGRDDVRVMVRYPAAERRSLVDVERMRIRLPDGTAVPFDRVATVDYGRGFASIQRTDRQRVINVTADVDERRANANEIVDNLKATILPALAADYRALSYGFEGEQREQSDTLGGLGRGFVLALLSIYALLAIPLRSYIQPLIIMSAIPFGFIGAVWGHVITGHMLSLFSMIGIVALAGIVVNDSLVLVSYVNRLREHGVPLTVAIRDAGVARFRAILLTSLTTFAGLTPLMLEKSVQAQFLIPMAISLGFGILFATSISLIMVPASYLILEDIRARWSQADQVACGDDFAAEKARLEG